MYKGELVNAADAQYRIIAHYRKTLSSVLLRCELSFRIEVL